MSIDAYILFDEGKSYVHLGKLGANGFVCGSFMRDPGGKNAGSFIGQFLGKSMSFVRCEDIPADYNECLNDSPPSRNPTLKLREIFADSECPYSVLAENHGHYVDFSVHEYGNYDAEIEPAIRGTIKWDGCSNWDFTWKNYPLHFCSRNQAKDFGKLFAALYDWAIELMPDHKEYLVDEKYS